VKFDNITNRIRALCNGLEPKYVDPVPITQKVIEGFYAGISTSEIDTLAAETCAYMSQRHPDFSTLAARIAISNLHKNTSSSFSEAVGTVVGMIVGTSPVGAGAVRIDFRRLALWGRLLGVVLPPGGLLMKPAQPCFFPPAGLSPLPCCMTSHNSRIRSRGKSSLCASRWFTAATYTPGDSFASKVFRRTSNQNGCCFVWKWPPD